MSTGAIIMMVLAITVLWGGLALAILNLRRSEVPSADETHRDL